MIKDIDKFGPTLSVLEPYHHQSEALALTWNLEYYGFFWEMGTGKSKPIIDTAARLFSKCEIDGLLIFSDKGQYLSWFYEEVVKNLPPNIPHRLAYWGSSMPTKDAKVVDEMLVAQDDCLDILCMNTESLAFERGFGVANRFVRSHYTMTVIDEATSIKNPKSKRWKGAMAIGKLSDYRRVLTGTPMTQGPLDLWAICEFLKPGRLGFQTFSEYRAHIADKIIQIPIGRFTLEKIVKYRNLDRISEIMRGFTSRVTKAECLDLPAKVYEVLYVDMSKEQREAYERLETEAILLLKQGMVTAINGLVLLTKLHQVCQGHVKSDDGQPIRLENAKMGALIDLVERIGKKCLIWCAFQEEVRWIKETLNEHFKEEGWYAIDYYGETTNQARVENKEFFLRDPNCLWWVGTAGVGGKGLNLTVASHAIYYSNSFKLEHRLQSEDRDHRIGQTEKCTYYDLVCRDTVDLRVMKALKDKKDVATEMLDTTRLLRMIQGA
jgi:SNF2 family DNA or RNA helicase